MSERELALHVSGFGLIAVISTILQEFGVIYDPILTVTLLLACFVDSWYIHAKIDRPLLSLSSFQQAFWLYAVLPFIWMMLIPGLSVSVHSRVYQSDWIVARSGQILLLGVSSMMCALYAAQLRGLRSRTKSPAGPGSRLHLNPATTIAALIVAAPLLAFTLPQQTMFSAGYVGASKTTLASQVELNALKPALYSALLLAIWPVLRKPTKVQVGLILCLAGFSIWGSGLSIGNRVEELGFIAALAWMIQARFFQGKTPKSWIPAGGALFLVFLLVGEYRNVVQDTTVDRSLWETASEVLLRMVPTGGVQSMKPTTNGDAAITLCAAVGMQETGVLSRDHGLVYLRYAEMTLPKMVNPNRPMQSASYIQTLTSTGGGWLFLNDAVLAEGSMGVLIVMGMFGWLLGKLETKVELRRLTPFAGYIYAVLMIATPRAVLYGSFSFYKIVLGGLGVYGIVYVVAEMIHRREGAGEAEWQRQARMAASGGWRA